MGVPGLLRRVFYYGPNIDQKGYGSENTKRDRCAPSAANLVSSELVASKQHAPALDIDVPAYLVPSTTEGHSHLYIDVPMSWRQYRKLLIAMRDAGILEPGYVAASLERRATFLRPPGVRKAA